MDYDGYLLDPSMMYTFMDSIEKIQFLRYDQRLEIIHPVEYPPKTGAKVFYAGEFVCKIFFINGDVRYFCNNSNRGFDECCDHSFDEYWDKATQEMSLAPSQLEYNRRYFFS